MTPEQLIEELKAHDAYELVMDVAERGPHLRDTLRGWFTPERVQWCERVHYLRRVRLEEIGNEVFYLGVRGRRAVGYASAYRPRARRAAGRLGAA